MVSGGRKLQSADRQMSEAFITSVFLAMSGGFQDAYTYFTRDEVFSNAQTGNVILMSHNFMTGQWGEGLRYLFPVLAFAIGVVAAERIQNTFKYAKKLHWRQMILLIEILILFVDIPEAGAEALMLLCGGIILLSLVMYGRFYHAILDQAPSGSQQQKTLRTARNVVLGLIWVGIIVICFLHRKELSAEEIARYTPGNPWLAGIVMLALFALKSLSIVIYSGVLYAANGILFPLPVAILLNLIGTVIMVTLPYQIGRRTGASAVDDIRAKYPKTEAIHSLRAKNDFLFSFLVRMVRLPSDVASLYMGAVHVEYKKYLLGSLLGMLPHTITYPIMGMSIQDIRSPQFIISLCAEIAYILVTSAVYTLYRKKNKADQ